MKSKGFSLTNTTKKKNKTTNDGVEMTETQKKKFLEWTSRILIPLITSLLVLGGSYLTFKGDLISANITKSSGELSAAFKRISHLEEELIEQQATYNTKIVQLTGEVFRLKQQLNRDLDIVEMFEDFMDSLPFEAWLKKVVKDEDGNPRFEMISINKRYELIHNITSNRYEGSLDSDIWSEEVAARFRENDMEVYKTKGSIITREKFPINPRKPDLGYQSKTIVKVYVDLLEGKEMIFGMALDLE